MKLDRNSISLILVIIGLGLILTPESSEHSARVEIHWVAGRNFGFIQFWQVGCLIDEFLGDSTELNFYYLEWGAESLFDYSMDHKGYFIVDYTNTIIGYRIRSITEEAS